MAYKCLECGHIFDEGEQAIWEEHHPYGMGYATEKFSGCPVCNGSYEETVQCQICGGEFLEDELSGGCVCDDCIEEYSNYFDICYKIADTEKEEVKINALLASLYSASDIEKILYHYTKISDFVDCSAFINGDKDWFASKLVEEVNE